MSATICWLVRAIERRIDVDGEDSTYSKSGGGSSKGDYYYSHALRPDDVKLLGRNFRSDHNNQGPQEQTFGGFS